ncbi:hypothetical protein [Plantactinospora endophytica]|uniref:hypothetical protein n=1 Tax=Plantactinospora endophytica TaxID=673535 RepID=UPI001940C2A2|nr:hypothetical protein [Plantactinospora endophytica]
MALREKQIVEGSFTEPDAAGQDPVRPRRPGLRGLARHLAALGPFALIFATYSLLIDHLPDQWFRQDSVRYLFAALAALCVGMTLRWLLQRPSVQRVVDPPTAPGGTLPGQRRPDDAPAVVESAKQILDGTRSRILADLRTASGVNGELYGWSQFIADKVPPSAIGTSYGLRIALALDIRHPRLDRRRLVENVVALQKPSKGWVARSQRDVARPEVTAWVLAALVRAGLDPDVREKNVEQLERMMSPGVDPIGYASVSVLTSVIAALAEVAPTSEKLEELTALLVAGAIRQDAGPGPRQLSWGRTLGDGERSSVPHTARAVVALHQAAAVIKQGRRQQLNEAVDLGIEWLTHNPDLAMKDEHLRRLAGDARDIIYIGHFTPAWVARALMIGEVGDRLPSLRRAVRAVLKHQENGVWKWKEQQVDPTWMTYQGVLVVRDYSMLNLPWPP